MPAFDDPPAIVSCCAFTLHKLTSASTNNSKIFLMIFVFGLKCGLKKDVENFKQLVFLSIGSAI